MSCRVDGWLQKLSKMWRAPWRATFSSLFCGQIVSGCVLCQVCECAHCCLCTSVPSCIAHVCVLPLFLRGWATPWSFPHSSLWTACCGLDMFYSAWCMAICSCIHPGVKALYNRVIWMWEQAHALPASRFNRGCLSGSLNNKAARFAHRHARTPTHTQNTV